MSPIRGQVGEDLPASGYPWAGPVRSGVIRPGGLVPGGLSAAATTGRTPVVAVGSNASPEVLRRKLADHLSPGIPIAPAVVDDLMVGHSAHVSARGYVAAAPGRVEGASAPVAVCWFDEEQLAALDATEPNYRRIVLPGGMPCRLPAPAATGGAAPDPADRVDGAQVYDSVHGVLGEDGRVLPLRDQAGVLAWLAERLPPGTVPQDHAALADARCREAVREQIALLGLRVRPAL
ncbi:hypothetical protein [Ornithinicoccus hortensis]|uniref:Uncharacterized protein n=1 Tax=Ornithinicoccus hortensis TaxID=82346 RepID=A0A542YUL2_9MICO|nr:hypothetical protein [Ornithinicoccus hortensis]TQL51778.1 hypothetical protein FB467_2940 [Ornithinicoccus hortensis]